ncbi:hypothetical protein GCM10027186_26950 [Micromonospora schwarzwaldensis]
MAPACFHHRDSKARIRSSRSVSPAAGSAGAVPAAASIDGVASTGDAGSVDGTDSAGDAGAGSGAATAGGTGSAGGTDSAGGAVRGGGTATPGAARVPPTGGGGSGRPVVARSVASADMVLLSDGG